MNNIKTLYDRLSLQKTIVYKVDKTNDRKRLAEEKRIETALEEAIKQHHKEKRNRLITIV